MLVTQLITYYFVGCHNMSGFLFRVNYVSRHPVGHLKAIYSSILQYILVFSCLQCFFVCPQNCRYMTCLTCSVKLTLLSDSERNCQITWRMLLYSNTRSIGCNSMILLRTYSIIKTISLSSDGPFSAETLHLLQYITYNKNVFIAYITSPINPPLPLLHILLHTHFTYISTTT